MMETRHVMLKNKFSSRLSFHNKMVETAFSMASSMRPFMPTPEINRTGRIYFDAAMEMNKSEMNDIYNPDYTAVLLVRFESRTIGLVYPKKPIKALFIIDQNSMCYNEYMEDSSYLPEQSIKQLFEDIGNPRTTKLTNISALMDVNKIPNDKDWKANDKVEWVEILNLDRDTEMQIAKEKEKERILQSSKKVENQEDECEDRGTVYWHI